MWINVVLAIDERIDDIKTCVDSLRHVYGSKAPIALATYGGVAVGPQPIVSEYAKAQGFLYFDAQRQLWLTEDDSQEWQCSETLARVQITKHFMDLGYDEIYIMHSDVKILGDFRTYFLREAKGQWSFIGNLVRASESFEWLCNRGSWDLWFDKNKARLADVLSRYNSKFIEHLYDKFSDDKGIWDGYLSKFTLWGDLAQFDIAKGMDGFIGRYIKDHTDCTPLCFGTILHIARQSIPSCLTEKTRKGIDRPGMIRNRQRRVG